MEASLTEVEMQLLKLSDHLANSISNRDAKEAARDVREDDHVAYISDGVVIRGQELRDVLARFYETMQRIDFRWDKREIVHIDASAAVIIGWATLVLVDSKGSAATEKALFTAVYRQTDHGWEFLTANKTTTK